MTKAKQDIDVKQMFDLPPEKAISYLQNKGYKITNDWRELWEDAHAKSFTIAKMTKLQMLKDTKNTLETALKEGWGEAQTKRELKNMFKSKGWWGKKTIIDENGEEKEIQLGSNYRVNTIYRQNIQSAFNAGRYLEQLEDVDFAPYFQYEAILDERTRPEHRALNDKVFRYDDPIWAYIYPPNGWGCRCIVRNLTEDEVKNKGLKVEKSDGKLSFKEVIINKDTGDTKPVAVFKTEDMSGRILNFQTDAGWSSNVGKAAWNIDVLAYNSIKDMPQNIKDKFISEMAQNIHSQKVYTNFIDKILKNGLKTQGIEKTVTWLQPNVLDALNEQKITPKTPVVVMQDDRVGHIVGDVKVAKQKISENQLYTIYDIINNPDEIYLDKTNEKNMSLLFVRTLNPEEITDKRDCIKVAVKLNKTNKKEPVNYIATAGRVNHMALTKDKNYKKIE
ncbi:MAG: phage minor head protein [Candidatus Gastranaerophilales bacterium]|nr:phage minor head protein [Candidatus Gastranaerophilales bacterium]